MILVRFKTCFKNSSVKSYSYIQFVTIIERHSILHKFQYRWCAIGIMANDENKEQKRIKKKKQCVKFTTHASYSIPHINITSHSSGSMSSLRAWYYSAPQIELEGWLRRPYAEPLIRWSNTQGSKTIWGSRNPLKASDWLLTSCPLQMGLDTLGAQYTPPPRTSMSTQPSAVGLETRFNQLP